MKLFSEYVLDEERALYDTHDALIENCMFDGPADGESALKESGDIIVNNCDFRLRYPLWHVENTRISDCRMSPTCRAAIWYGTHLVIENCDMNGIKALRECGGVTIGNSRIDSAEFGWRCRGLKIFESSISSEYPFFESRDMEIDRLKLTGKYSFQYVENAVIRYSVLDTKDAFWHSKNVTVEDSVINGEYLGWYSEGLTLVRCRIKGTQPLCWCSRLVIRDCEFEDADLAFEKSDVDADIKGGLISVKNPVSGCITADSIGEVIIDRATECKIKIRK